MKPPFDDKFFTELKSTIRDFMKIGKKSFCYDFRHVEALDPPVAEHFEDLIPTLSAGKCSLKIIQASDQIVEQLPAHQDFLMTSKKDTSRHTNFILESTISKSRNQAVINLKGEFIEQDALEEFKTRSIQIMEKVDSIILNFAKLNHISTIAVGGLIYLKVHCDKDGKKVAVCHIPPSIKSTLEMSGILHLIPVFSSLKQAKAHLQDT
ncbi:STAS domain-containing protein [Fibrobacterota bacterium]